MLEVPLFSLYTPIVPNILCCFELSLAWYADVLPTAEQNKTFRFS